MENPYYVCIVITYNICTVITYALIAQKPQHHKATPSINNVTSKVISNDNYEKCV